MSLRGFEIEIDRFIAEDVVGGVTKLQRVVATGGLQKVNLKSPVDTGRFRGGWVVSVNSTRDDDPNRLDPSGALSLSEGLGVINKAPAFSEIYVQNNVEYAEALEDGHSGQAPEGILAISVAELETVFK